MTFKSFITEVALLKMIDKDDKLDTLAGKRLHPEDYPSYEFDDSFHKMQSFEKIDSLKGHDIYKVKVKHTPRYGKTSNQDHYILHDPKTKKVHLHVIGNPTRYKTMKIDRLSSSGESPVKAHEFYHHLLGKHIKAIETTSQSEGGMKVWQKLARKKDVSVHGWDHSTNQPVNVDHQNSNETHVSYDDYRSDTEGIYDRDKLRDIDNKYKSQSDMTLVASRIKPKVSK